MTSSNPLGDPRYAGLFDASRNPELWQEFSRLVDGLSKEAARAQELEKQLRIDPLTGLFNKAYFTNELGKAISFSKREEAKGLYLPVCAAIGDIDFFKEYNDTFGHPAGDEALERISLAMLEALRDYDITCRYGGEEFGIILPDTHIDSGVKVLERVRERVYNSSLKNLKRPVTMTFGVAEYPPDGAVAEELIAAADRALYEGKRTGRNCVRAARYAT